MNLTSRRRQEIIGRVTLVFDLSFILWDLLGAITGGIVTLFYVHPYRQLTRGALYEKLK